MRLQTCDLRLATRDFMERLWSPWRLAYVTASDREAGCIFCDAAGAVAFGGGALFWVLGYILGLVGSEQRGGTRALQISLAVLVGFLLSMIIEALRLFLHPHF